MSAINSIRQLRREGYSVSDIARKTSVSRDTVYKYLKKDDFSPRIPASRRRKSKVDPCRPIIERWLDEDLLTWKKQRHTARRIWQRLRDEYGFDGRRSSRSSST
ncbi:MAG TPA: helix-turn-helix domain-containing protein [Candidatus Aphodovivens excrementavium]|nr:helix-turn-helix domain-containing protein [Candidatus Aphodovivens excrementavium]